MGMLDAVLAAMGALWLQVCRYVYYWYATMSLKPANDFYHKVVVLGDDFAAGVGDRAVLGRDVGLPRYLQALIKRNTDKVRHRWDVINCGIRGSTAADWDPTSDKKYYQQVTKDRRVGDASIVLVLLGSVEQRDTSFNAEATCKHLMALCDALRKKERQVCLATVASKDPLHQGSEDCQLNKLITEYCASTKEDDIPVLLGPRLDAYAFRRAHDLARDEFHFNFNAYKLLARNTADFVIPMMTAIEWKTWKKRVSTVTYDKALYD